MESSKKFKFVVDSIEGEKAVLLFETDQKLTVPLKELRGDISEGDALFAVFTEYETETARVRDLAKEVLNEILDTDEDI